MNRIEKIVNGTKVTAEKFNSISEFLKEYEHKEISANYANHETAKYLQDETYTEHKQEFTGVSGYAEAVNQLKNGVNVSAIKSARTAAAAGTKRQVKKSVNGGRVSVPAYLNGSPACMRRSCRLPAKTELNIVVDTGVHCGVTSEQITEAGKTIVKFITELEERYNVNLHAAVATNINKKVYTCSIKIKDAGKPFSAARVSFCLTSAAFLRVFGFIWITRANKVPYALGLGTPTSSNAKQEKEVMNAIHKNAVLVSLADVISKGEKGLPTIK